MCFMPQVVAKNSSSSASCAAAWAFPMASFPPPLTLKEPSTLPEKFPPEVRRPLKEGKPPKMPRVDSLSFSSAEETDEIEVT